MEKKKLRHEMLTTLKKLSKVEHDCLSQQITERLLLNDSFLNANTIGITISRFPEVNTKPIIEAAWAMGKRIAVPRCVRETKQMDFRMITSYNTLETVYIDLLEPIISKTEKVMKDQIDLQIVPGVVYSTNGFRIGFGGGYYDRYLTDYKGDTISIAFDCQIVPTVPVDPYDISVQSIITENRMIDCGKGDAV